jgi:NTP pyrophosphatase (non-canonical NTP hydrolase)
MNYEKYRRDAARTMNPTLTWEQHLANGALGLAGEVSEIAALFAHQDSVDKSDLLNEMGDVTWYAAYLMTTISMDMTDMAQRVAAARPPGMQLASPSPDLAAASLLILTASVGSVTEPIKKALYHGKALDLLAAQTATAQLLAAVEQLAWHAMRTTMAEVTEHNVKKLMLRYPEGFQMADPIVETP